MSITIAEALKLSSLRSFRLVAGEWGLDKRIDKIGILEYENSREIIHEQFGRGDFVITSFFYAKDDVDILRDSIQSLINVGVSGLAIKNVYYNELPADIVRLASEKTFPIFIFDRSTYFEDIITDIMDAVRNKDKYEILESKVDILIKNNISKSMIRELTLDINNSFKNSFAVAYCKEKKFTNLEDIYKKLNDSNRVLKNNTHHSIFKYKDGLLFIYTYEGREAEKQVKNMLNILDDLRIRTDKYSIGIGKPHYNLNEMDKGISEALYTVRGNEVMSEEIMHYKDIGLYKILLPCIDDYWVREFYNDTILKLIKYDKKHNASIFSTALIYVESDGNIKNTAKALFQHDNTIRYRVNKIKEILGMVGKDGGFYEQLSLGIKIHKSMDR